MGESSHKFQSREKDECFFCARLRVISVCVYLSVYLGENSAKKPLDFNVAENEFGKFRILHTEEVVGSIPASPTIQHPLNHAI